MGYPVDIVVTSNISKELGPDVQVIVGLPDQQSAGVALCATERFLPKG